jgi:hypothetical protein
MIEVFATTVRKACRKYARVAQDLMVDCSRSRTTLGGRRGTAGGFAHDWRSPRRLPSPRPGRPRARQRRQSPATKAARAATGTACRMKASSRTRWPRRSSATAAPRRSAISANRIRRWSRSTPSGSLTARIRSCTASPKSAKPPNRGRQGGRRYTTSWDVAAGTEVLDLAHETAHKMLTGRSRRRHHSPTLPNTSSEETADQTVFGGTRQHSPSPLSAT